MPPVLTKTTQDTRRGQKNKLVLINDINLNFVIMHFHYPLLKPEFFILVSLFVKTSNTSRSFQLVGVRSE